MKMTYGAQQSDAWLKARVGRLTASRMADICDYVAKGSIKRGDKRLEESAKRSGYRTELISERMTGLTKDHFNSAAMQRGSGLEPQAIQCYEDISRSMVEPVNFVVHPQYDFTGATPDGLIGTEGMLEVKCLLPWNHLKAVEDKEIAPERFAQVGWQLACAGKERRWSDLVHFCPNIGLSCKSLVYDCRRIGRDELQWTISIDEKEKRLLTGEAVIDYFTSEVLKLNAEIEFFMAENDAKPVAPYPVKLIEEERAEETPADLDNISGPAWEFLDQV